MIKLNDPDEVYKWDFKTLWNALKIIVKDNGVHYESKLKEIKEGKRLKIPIAWIINEWFLPYPSGRVVTIMGQGKFRMIDFYEELDHRENLMREIILDNVNGEEVIEPRVK